MGISVCSSRGIQPLFGENVSLRVSRHTSYGGSLLLASKKTQFICQFTVSYVDVMDAAPTHIRFAFPLHNHDAYPLRALESQAFQSTSRTNTLLQLQHR